MPEERSVTHRWFSRHALLYHLAIVIWFPGCLVAGWWQVTVALSGDALGWLYSVEWPVFAIFGSVVWWHLIHDDPNDVGARALARARAAAAARAAGPEALARSGPTAGISADVVRAEPTDDPDLAEYNAFLARLAEENRPKTWRRS